MTTALDKLVALYGPQEDVPAWRSDPAGEVVLSALADLQELQVLLADSDDDSDDSGSGSSNGGSDDDEDDNGQLAKMVAKLVAKGVPKARAMQMAKQAMKRVAASALADSAIVALSKLSLPPAIDGGELKLSVLTMEERKKPSAHTIKGSTDYPIPDKGHLQAAIARYKQGKLAGHSKDEVKNHILHHARRLGVQVDL